MIGDRAAAGAFSKLAGDPDAGVRRAAAQSAVALETGRGRG